MISYADNVVEYSNRFNKACSGNCRCTNLSAITHYTTVWGRS